MHGESWYGEHLHPGARAWRHLQYDRYLLDEVLPVHARGRTPTPIVITTGRELRRLPRGLLRLPPSGPGQPDHRHERPLRHEAAHRRLLRRQRVRLQPVRTSCRHEHDPARLEALRRQDIILAIGRDDPTYENNRAFSAALWDKGIGNALRVWDGWAHDWPYWERMIRQYIGGHD